MEKNQNLEWMLWQISVAENEQPPAYHLVHAICYFIEKYGQVPNRCEVSDGWKGILDVYEGVEITHTKSVQNNSLMLTFDESLEAHKTKIY
jgi:hypothetical protein